MPSGKANKRLRRELMTQPKTVIQTVQKSELFQGPLPDPEMLERYKNADSSFPERIMRMAEAHNAADVKTKNRISLSNLIVPIIGQIFTLMLGAGGIAACVYLAKAGFTGGAIATMVGSFSPMVINAFRGLRQTKK
ncbi:MAG: hypothetical protein LBH35_07915 [Treponema sp.]|jgi:uncharacterized membrane protein|nr:hypothetical protein [Treponema sp.]